MVANSSRQATDKYHRWQKKERTPELKKLLKHFYSKLGFRHSSEHYMVKDARDCHAQRMRARGEQFA